MSKLSISRAWDETKAVFRRDGRLIAIVALALLVLPGTLSALVQPQTPPGEVAQPGWWSGVSLLTLLIGIVGQLAIVRVALGERQTVGEAITHGLRRTLAFLGATIIWLLPFAVLFAPFVMQIQASPQSPPRGATMAVLALTIVFLFILVRFILATPVAGAEQVGPVGILKRSWTLTRGHFWRLFGMLLLFLIAVMIVGFAAMILSGIVTQLLFGALEPMSVGALLIALVTQLAAAALTTMLMVLLTRVYLQRTGADAESASVPHAP